ncbi:hypothetical protein BB561_003507 [Smittium simulii]|uniref:J domain-containing protein n=1 Tax=Smittium simulii TaxID=133385 RepID=A0A2T9YL38_9FUNG|nr:hypothetical protein BB561_003507 [Smittium simulii]
MANYTYDESGQAIFSNSSSKNKASTLKLRAVKSEKKSNWSFIKYILLALSWSAFFMIGSHLKNSDYSVPNQWDPYFVLGLDSGADVSQIKRAFKKLSLKFHPDKIRGTDKEAAEIKYIEITRAHRTLTDDEARENFDKYGNPDGLLTRTMGIALPRILVEARTSPFLMILYGLIVGFLLPYYVGSWCTGDLAYSSSQEADLTDLAAKINSASKEYAHYSFGKSTKFDSMSAWKAKVLLYAHFYRIEIQNPVLSQQQQEIIEKSIHLVHKGLIQISSAQGWSNCTFHLIHILQMLVQGVHEFAPPLAQLPYINYSIYKQIALAFSLLHDNTDMAINVLNSIPQVEFTRSILSVIGDSVITPLAIVTLLVKIKILNPSSNSNSAAVDINHKKAVDMFNLVNEQDTEAVESLYTMVSKIKQTQIQAPEATAPYISAKKLSGWWFILSNPGNSKNVVAPIFISDLVTDKIISIQFQAPNAPGSYYFQANLFSDSYVGCDISQNIEMQVSDPKLLPLEPEIDDDISEPEANSLAAQLAEARNQSGNTRNNNRDDSSDDE